MKRFVAVIIIIAAVITLTAASSVIINNFYNSFTKEIENIEMLYQSNQISHRHLTLLQKKWNRCEGLLMLFANHDSLDDIKLNIIRLSSAAKNKNSSSFYTEAEELKCRLYFLKENESISFKSIF